MFKSLVKKATKNVSLLEHPSAPKDQPNEKPKNTGGFFSSVVDAVEARVAGGAAVKEEKPTQTATGTRGQIQGPSFTQLIPWKGQYRPKNPSTKLQGVEPATITQIGVPEAVGDSLEALLSHYPQIVYFGVTFWRKILIFVHPERNFRVDLQGAGGGVPHLLPSLGLRRKAEEEEKEKEGKEKESEAASAPPDLEEAIRSNSESRTSSGRAHPRELEEAIRREQEEQVEKGGKFAHLGICGDIGKFTQLPSTLSTTGDNLLPRGMMTSRRPLSRDCIEEIKPLKEERQEVIKAVGLFMSGILAADQRDVLHVMLESFQISRTDFWVSDGLGNQGTLFHNSCRASPISSTVPEMLLQLGPSEVAARGIPAPVHALAAVGNLQLLQQLVEEYDCPVNVEGSVPQKWLPLHFAALWGHTEVVAYLLHRDPVLKQLGTKEKDAETATEEKKENKGGELMSGFYQEQQKDGTMASIPDGYHWDEESSFYYSDEAKLYYDPPSGKCNNGVDGEWFALLPQQKADEEDDHSNGAQKKVPTTDSPTLNLALHAAATFDTEGNLETMKLLVLRGANVNFRNREDARSTALVVAAKNGNLRGVEFLVNEGTHLTKKDDSGRYAVDHARARIPESAHTTTKKEGPGVPTTISRIAGGEKYTKIVELLEKPTEEAQREKDIRRKKNIVLIGGGLAACYVAGKADDKINDTQTRVKCIVEGKPPPPKNKPDTTLGTALFGVAAVIGGVCAVGAASSLVSDAVSEKANDVKSALSRKERKKEE